MVCVVHKGYYVPQGPLVVIFSMLRDFHQAHQGTFTKRIYVHVSIVPVKSHVPNMFYLSDLEKHQRKGNTLKNIPTVDCSNHILLSCSSANFCMY